MRPFTASAILAFAALAHAQTPAPFPPTALVQNYCGENVFITLANTTGTSGPFQLNPGEAYLTTITGVGNSLGVTKTSAYWSPDTPKLILGSSVSASVLYWTVSSVDGNPFAGESFNVTSVKGTAADLGVCGGSTGYDGQVHACAADDVHLMLRLC